MDKTLTLNGKRFTVVKMAQDGMDLRGPRGGESALVRNLKNPTHWAHIIGWGKATRAIWYKATDTGLVEI